MAILCHTRAAVDSLTRELTAHDIPLTPLATWDGEPDDNIKIGTINLMFRSYAAAAAQARA